MQQPSLHKIIDSPLCKEQSLPVRMLALTVQILQDGCWLSLRRHRHSVARVCSNPLCTKLIDGPLCR